MRKKLFQTIQVLAFLAPASVWAQKACTTMEKQALIKKDMQKTHIDSSGRGLADNYYLWEPGTVLRVKFLSGSPALRSKVMSAANEWSKYANIKFRTVTSGQSDIRVLLGEDEGHNSYVGTVCKMISEDEQTMNLDTTDFLTDKSLNGTAMHEFGHALGLLHEHSSPVSGIKWNKDSIYKVYWKRYGWSKSDVDYQVFRTYSQSYTNGSAYDSKSIMHYSIEPWETVNHYSVPWNYYMSAGDRELIAALYPKKGPRKNEVARVSIANFRKMEAVENTSKKGLSLYPSFDLISYGKSGKIYFLGEFFDSNGDPIEDSDGYYSFENRVVAFRTITTIPGKKISYNKTKKDFEIFIPYDQMELPSDLSDVLIRFRVILQTDEGEIKDVYYGSAAAFSFSKIQPAKS